MTSLFNSFRIQPIMYLGILWNAFMTRKYICFMLKHNFMQLNDLFFITLLMCMFSAINTNRWYTFWEIQPRQLTFQMLTLQQKYLYHHSQYSRTCDSKCLALITQVVRAFGMKVGGSSPPQDETFSVSKISTLSQEWIENECCCPRTVNISNVYTHLLGYKRMKPWC